LLSRLARTYAPRVAQHWAELDATLQRCFRSTDPLLRLHAVKVTNTRMRLKINTWAQKFV
jgi:uncharacterized linocin/CFP29 family protein